MLVTSRIFSLFLGFVNPLTTTMLQSNFNLYVRSLVTALLACLTFSVQAQAWPTKPVRMIVPAPAGSSLDIVARLLSDSLKDTWGQAVIVDNKPGAGGLLGTDLAAKAAPDGHTLVLSFNGPIAFAKNLYKKMPYDAERDLIAVAMTTAQPNVLAVNAALPVKSVKELIAYAKANPNSLNFASIGNGSSSHLTMELLKARAGISLQHVPFNGSPPASLSVANGETQLLFAVASGIAPMVKLGKVRLLAVSSAKRFEQLADLPALAETPNLKGFEAMAWNGLFVAKGTPVEVVNKINRDVNTALSSTAIKARLYAQGMQASPASSQAFSAMIASDRQTWGALIEQLNIKLD